ncbi:hypothetical protein MBANPS3_004538 [Mucor bainieri]
MSYRCNYRHDSNFYHDYFDGKEYRDFQKRREAEGANQDEEPIILALYVEGFKPKSNSYAGDTLTLFHTHFECRIEDPGGFLEALEFNLSQAVFCILTALPSLPLNLDQASAKATGACQVLTTTPLFQIAIPQQEHPLRKDNRSMNGISIRESVDFDMNEDDRLLQESPTEENMHKLQNEIAALKEVIVMQQANLDEKDDQLKQRQCQIEKQQELIEQQKEQIQAFEDLRDAKRAANRESTRKHKEGKGREKVEVAKANRTLQQLLAKRDIDNEIFQVFVASVTKRFAINNNLQLVYKTYTADAPFSKIQLSEWKGNKPTSNNAPNPIVETGPVDLNSHVQRPINNSGKRNTTPQEPTTTRVLRARKAITYKGLVASSCEMMK